MLLTIVMDFCCCCYSYLCCCYYCHHCENFDVNLPVFSILAAVLEIIVTYEDTKLFPENKKRSCVRFLCLSQSQWKGSQLTQRVCLIALHFSKLVFTSRDVFMYQMILIFNIICDCKEVFIESAN
jgi:hypothetical protein